MPKGGAEGKVSNGLVAVSCAAVLAVYAAGYSRTREAAERFDTQAQERRPAVHSERTAAAVQPTDSPVVPTRPRAEPDASSVRRVDASPVASVAKERIPQAIDTPSAAPVSAPVETAVAPVTVTPAPVPAAPPEPAATPEAPPAPKWKDGTYTGWGRSRHGDIEARVVIKDGRIAESGIAQCLTRYSCDVIDWIITQPVKRQDPEVDFVSRATESADAYYYGLVEALGKARISQ